MYCFFENVIIKFDIQGSKISKVPFKIDTKNYLMNSVSVKIGENNRLLELDQDGILIVYKIELENEREIYNLKIRKLHEIISTEYENKAINFEISSGGDQIALIYLDKIEIYKLSNDEKIQPKLICSHIMKKRILCFKFIDITSYNNPILLVVYINDKVDLFYLNRSSCEIKLIQNVFGASCCIKGLRYQEYLVRQRDNFVEILNSNMASIRQFELGISEY